MQWHDGEIEAEGISIKAQTLQPLKQKETSCKVGEKQETKTRVLTLKTLWSTKSLPLRFSVAFFE